MSYEVAEVANILAPSITNLSGKQYGNTQHYAKELAKEITEQLGLYYFDKYQKEDVIQASKKYKALEKELADEKKLRNELIDHGTKLENELAETRKLQKKYNNLNSSFIGLSDTHENLKKANLELHEKYIKSDAQVNSEIEKRMKAEQTLEQAINANAKIYDDLLAKEVRIGKLIDLLLILGSNNVSNTDS